jgi:hypothetical protein
VIYGNLSTTSHTPQPPSNINTVILEISRAHLASSPKQLGSKDGAMCDLLILMVSMTIRWRLARLINHSPANSPNCYIARDS